MTSIGAKPFSEPKTAGLFEFRPVEVGGKLMRLVEHDQVPRSAAKLVLQILVARHLVKPHDELVLILKGIAAGRSDLEFLGEEAELQAELLEKLIAPLFDQTAGRDDEHTAGVSAHKQFPDVEAGHDRFARARIVGEEVAQRLMRQHSF